MAKVIESKWSGILAEGSHARLGAASLTQRLMATRPMVNGGGRNRARTCRIDSFPGCT
jgi:hypothetical protein